MSITGKTRNALGAVGRGIDSKAEQLLAFLAVMSLFASDNRAQNGIVDTVIVVVVVGIVGIVGILIFSEVDSAIEVEGELANSSAALGDGFGSAMGLLPVVLIVLVASLVIIVISGMRGR